MLWRVADAGSLAFAKIWRIDPAFPEVKSIWTHEIRNLLRLGSLPFAEEVFVRLRDVGTDDAGLIVILAGDGREPLATALANRSRYPWLSDLRSSRTRLRLWRGLLRVARGLAMLHSEGTLHRMLRPDSIFTDLDGSCDFRLSGFEWSLRVAPSGAESDKTSINAVEAPELSHPAAQYSVASDWFSFGLLCAQITAGINLPTEAAKQGPRNLRKTIAGAGLTVPEKSLIVDLIDPDPERRMWHASEISESIESIIESLTGERDQALRPLYAGFDLGRDSALSKLIVKHGAGTIAGRDVEAQLSFIKDDLGREPQVTARLRPFPHYVLHGAHIDYQLRRWSAGATQTWEAALCNRHDHFQTAEATRIHRFTGRRIEIHSAAWVASNRRSVGTLGEHWDEAFSLEEEKGFLNEEQTQIVNFFRLTNQLEALLTITEIWPVEIVCSGEFEGEQFVDATPIIDADRDRLSKLLGVPTPAEQMLRVFQKDELVGKRAAENAFVFSDEGRLSRRESGRIVKWRFIAYRDHLNGPRYRFAHEQSANLLPSGLVYLRPSDLAGSSILLHRRKKAIDDLHAHRVLLDAIDDPTLVKRTTIDELHGTSSAEKLDPSKKLALNEIWRSQPFYALQGPPGTGKTTLVASMAVEQAATSASTQILITAQSHSTVDTVMKEVLDELGPSAPILAIRLDSDGPQGTRASSSRLSQLLAGCEFAQQAPAQICARLTTLSLDKGAAGKAERTGFERLVEDGAGILFATSNSGDLARLIEAGRRYDWSIIEEAGRAHGFDLALPLQASHRVLMIGDHQQLPAFNLDVLDALLREPDRILQSLRFGNRYAPTLVERHFVNEISSDEDSFRNNCQAWRDLLPFFKTVYERCERAGSIDGETIARQLTHQHRMHPEIMEIVAECFYPALETAEVARTRFEKEPDPFTIRPDSWMPANRIVFLNTPWLQRGRNARGEVTRPRYHSPVEVDIVLSALSQLRRAVPLSSTNATNVRPTLQVLSPYRAQVNRIRRAVQRARASGLLLNLDDFDLRGSDGEIGATVDEFQGNQADIIIVSLVRNNHTKAGKGLGILADGRRWNVLLSRAKRKLILIGSLDFLRSRIPQDIVTPDDDPMYDLAKVMAALESSTRRGTAGRVELQDIPPLLPSHPGAASRRRRRYRGPRK